MDSDVCLSGSFAGETVKTRGLLTGIATKPTALDLMYKFGAKH